MNKTYKATFKLPAVVHFVVEVSALNQQDALVMAHDMVLEAKPANTVVSTVDPQGAVNIALECVTPDSAMPPASVAALPSLLSAEPTLTQVLAKEAVPFTVKFFDNNTASGEPSAQVQMPSRRLAEQVGSSALEPLSEYGSAKVFDENGQAISQFFSPRGGWEVETDGVDVPRLLSSWLPDKLSAMKAALKVLNEDKRVSCARVYDFTTRKAGSVLFKELS